MYCYLSSVNRPSSSSVPCTEQRRQRPRDSGHRFALHNDNHKVVQIGYGQPSEHALLPHFARLARKGRERVEFNDLYVNHPCARQRKRAHGPFDRCPVTSKIKTAPGPPDEYSSIELPSA